MVQSPSPSTYESFINQLQKLTDRYLGQASITSHDVPIEKISTNTEFKLSSTSPELALIIERNGYESIVYLTLSLSLYSWCSEIWGHLGARGTTFIGYKGTGRRGDCGYSGSCGTAISQQICANVLAIIIIYKQDTSIFQVG